MNETSIQFTPWEIILGVSIVVGIVVGIIKIIEFSAGKSKEKEKQDMKNLLINNEQDKKMDLLDHRVTNLEHNMGKIEGLILSLDTRLNQSIMDVHYKIELQGKEIIKQIIEINKK